MIISSYDPRALHQAFGIGMSDVEGLGVGAGWGRVAPDVVWAKLTSLRDGARLASERVFGQVD